jgi:hypothetical protein
MRLGHRKHMTCRAWRIEAAAVLLGLALLVVGPSIASAHEQAPSPSPTLGSTTSPHPNPPGSTDSSPRDYNGAVWVVVGALIVVVIVGGGTLYLMRTGRLDLKQRSSPGTSDAPPAENGKTATGRENRRSS